MPPSTGSSTWMRCAVKGSPIGMGDSLIAGIVLLHKGIFLTRNPKHFERVPGLFISCR